LTHRGSTSRIQSFAYQEEVDVAVFSLPLFMRRYTIVDAVASEPEEGRDYVYDQSKDVANWMNEAAAKTKCSTASKGKVDDSKYDD